FDEHRDGTGNLYMTIAPLRWAAALAGRQLAVAKHLFPDEALANRGVGGDLIAHFPPVALAQILNRDLGETRVDEIGGRITHRWPPGVDGRWPAVVQRCREAYWPNAPTPRAFRLVSDGRHRLYARPFAHGR